MYGFLLNKNFMIFQLLTWWNSGKTATLLGKTQMNRLKLFFRENHCQLWFTRLPTPKFLLNVINNY